MESTVSDQESPFQGLELRFLGPVRLVRAGTALQLPASRKLRILTAYLALASHPVSRERLCDLLWPVPNDPRSELRWCLSKLRPLLDEPARPRVLSQEGRIALDLDGCRVDALGLLRDAHGGWGDVSAARLQALATEAAGDFLEGLEADDSPELTHWLAARRGEFRSLRGEIAAEIARRASVGTPEGLAAARTWLEVAPLDARSHQRFLAELFHRRLIDEGNRHVEASARSFAAEDIDFAPVRAAWATLRSTAVAPSVDPVPAAPLAPRPDAREAQAGGTRRASIAVMPFTGFDSGNSAGGLGGALTHDVITRLARLRSLFVIARGSTFALAEDALDLHEIGKRLGVDYVATGYIERHADKVVVTVELAEAATSRILWTDRFEAGSSERLAVLDGVCDGIVSSIAAEIETAERNRALLKPPDSLDAWESYHRGLWHMYRFTLAENAQAARFFRQAIRLDPTFSRAYAGLSFAHWQNAFQRWDDRDSQTRQALDAAGQSLLADSQNPAAYWAMGRALWLSGETGEATRALQQSVRLSPNFALGHYALAFVQSQAGDPAEAIVSSDQSRLLSPCDPMLFGMLAARAMALVRLEDFEEAAQWALKAASRPNAHVHVLAIAAHCLALAGRIEEARTLAARIRTQQPGYAVADFLDTFRFEKDTQSRYLAAARRIGL